jgi:hypothetical protein
MNPELQAKIDAAWTAYQQTLPDRSELSAYQLARSKELFTAGYLAALTTGSAKGQA